MPKNGYNSIALHNSIVKLPTSFLIKITASLKVHILTQKRSFISNNWGSIQQRMFFGSMNRKIKIVEWFMYEDYSDIVVAQKGLFHFIQKLY